jgi:Holliday junction DNA helicase RuvA
MVVELRDKLEAVETPAPEQPSSAPKGITGDVVSALLNLGYDRAAAERAVEQAGRSAAPDSFEALLRATLRQLSAPAQKGARAAY